MADVSLTPAPSPLLRSTPPASGDDGTVSWDDGKLPTVFVIEDGPPAVPQPMSGLTAGGTTKAKVGKA